MKKEPESCSGKRVISPGAESAGEMSVFRRLKEKSEAR